MDDGITDEMVDVAAKAISPEWFNVRDGKCPLDNYPNQHRRYQQQAREKARAALTAAIPLLRSRSSVG